MICSSVQPPMPVSLSGVMLLEYTVPNGPSYGFLRPIIPEVVEKFLECGDLARGFARIRCDHCKEDRLLAFSCKGRWFCPSCHQKKVQLFGALLAESILYLVPHRHFGIPKMLRPYFRYDRDLLKDLCRVAHECLIEFLRTSLGLPKGVPGIVMAIHTFGEYLDFHLPAARACSRRAVCAFGGLPRHARDLSQALEGTLPRQVRLRVSCPRLPTQGRKSPSFFPEKLPGVIRRYEQFP